MTRIQQGSYQKPTMYAGRNVAWRPVRTEQMAGRPKNIDDDTTKAYQTAHAKRTKPGWSSTEEEQGMRRDRKLTDKYSLAQRHGYTATNDSGERINGFLRWNTPGKAAEGVRAPTGYTAIDYHDASTADHLKRTYSNELAHISEGPKAHIKHSKGNSFYYEGNMRHVGEAASRAANLELWRKTIIHSPLGQITSQRLRRMGYRPHRAGGTMSHTKDLGYRAAVWPTSNDKYVMAWPQHTTAYDQAMAKKVGIAKGSARTHTLGHELGHTWTKGKKMLSHRKLEQIVGESAGQIQRGARMQDRQSFHRQVQDASNYYKDFFNRKRGEGKSRTWPQAA